MKLVEMSDQANNVVLPGDVVMADIPEDKQIIVGPGLRRDANRLVAVKPGLLKRTEDKTLALWVESHEKRYIPTRSEDVVGFVIKKTGETFTVDIGSSEPASLSYLAFQGATKRNRPNVQIGDILYAKLLTANKDMAPEVVCVDGYGKSNGLGVLDASGFVFSVPINLARKILSPSCVLLKSLGKTLKFEIAVGMNGRIWIRDNSIKEVIAIYNAICISEHMSNSEIQAMCAKVLDVLAGF